jgi:hypothetical protein
MNKKLLNSAKIGIAHCKDGIKEYQRESWKKNEKYLLAKVTKLYKIGFDLRKGDVLDNNNGDNEDVIFFKIKERTVDIRKNTLFTTFWFDDL